VPSAEATLVHPLLRVALPNSTGEGEKKKAMALVVAAVAAKHAVATSAESSAMARAVMGMFFEEQLPRRACPHQHRNVRETEMLDPKSKRLP